jgi:hypothetical protein
MLFAFQLPSLISVYDCFLRADDVQDVLYGLITCYASCFWLSVLFRIIKLENHPLLAVRNCLFSCSQLSSVSRGFWIHDVTTPLVGVARDTLDMAMWCEFSRLKRLLWKVSGSWKASKVSALDECLTRKSVIRICLTLKMLVQSRFL